MLESLTLELTKLIKKFGLEKELKDQITKLEEFAKRIIRRCETLADYSEEDDSLSGLIRGSIVVGVGSGIVGGGIALSALIGYLWKGVAAMVGTIMGIFLFFLSITLAPLLAVLALDIVRRSEDLFNLITKIKWYLLKNTRLKKEVKIIIEETLDDMGLF